ncbi:hypothetical protein MTO96_015011 [Rhipicephalus appendiculatus]
MGPQLLGDQGQATPHEDRTRSASSTNPVSATAPWQEPLNRPRPWTLDGPPELDLGQDTGLDLGGTSCPTPASGTPGQKLLFVCPRRFHPGGTRTFPP